jgi:hypothetical protein
MQRQLKEYGKKCKDSFHDKVFSVKVFKKTNQKVALGLLIAQYLENSLKNLKI